MAQEIAVLRKLSTDELVARYRAAFGREPRVRHKEWMWKRISWRIQERRLGGLSKVAKARLEELIAAIDLPIAERQRTVSGKLAAKSRPTDPPIGTVFTREWRGREVRVTVVEGGFEFNGEVYRSLTAAVRAATGAHWNPKLFFDPGARRKTS
jgi:hypothetical protein